MRSRGRSPTPKVKKSKRPPGEGCQGPKAQNDVKTKRGGGKKDLRTYAPRLRQPRIVKWSAREVCNRDSKRKGQLSIKGPRRKEGGDNGNKEKPYQAQKPQKWEKEPSDKKNYRQTDSTMLAKKRRYSLTYGGKFDERILPRVGGGGEFRWQRKEGGNVGGDRERSPRFVEGLGRWMRCTNRRVSEKKRKGCPSNEKENRKEQKWVRLIFAKKNKEK